jgi:hypothetical protein
MKKLLAVLFVVFVMALCLIYFLFKSGSVEKAENYISKIFQNNEDGETNSDDSGFSSGEAGGGGSGGGEGGGGGSGEASSSGSSCSLRKISYSLKEFNKVSTCNQYEGDVCISKTVNCSLEVTNLDFEISGNFEIKFEFFEQGQEEILYSAEDAQVLGPRESAIFEASANFQGADAGKELTCDFSTEQIPQREVCF